MIIYLRLLEKELNKYIFSKKWSNYTNNASIKNMKKKIKLKNKLSKVSSKVKKSLILLDKIEKVRSKNNKNWMDILRLSIKLDYKRTSNLIKQIYKHDSRISTLAKKIYNQN